MSGDVLETVFRCAEAPSPFLTQSEAEVLAGADLEALKRLGFLRKTSPAYHAVCETCGGQHIEDVARAEYPDGEVRFYMMCPECGRVEVEPDRLLCWALDFTPLLDAVASRLEASGRREEVVPERVWRIGRATVAGRSRVVWVARGLAWPDAGTFAEHLPSGRSPLLFHLGRAPAEGLLNLPVDAVVPLDTVLHFEEGALLLDRAAVENHASMAAQKKTARKPRKRSRRAATIDGLKKLLRAHLRRAKNYAHRTRREKGHAELLPRPTMEFLARALDVSVSTVSRAINDPNDKETSILWEAALDLDRVMKFRW